ncbi:MAG: bifunctional UDP-sugar hydrolase/5'-nucleotidase, partial [Angelakisella sp.]
MICSLFVPAMAADEKKEAPAPYAIGDVKGKLVVLHTNDIHGRIKADSYNKILGMTAVAAMKDQYEKAGASVLVLDAGDTLHGMPILGGFKGSSMVDVMNEVGYTAMTPGNHDFNYGYERLLELKKEMKFPLLAANVTYEKDGKPVFEANTIVEAGSYKVGIFGLATVETMTKTNPNNVKGIKFASGEALYQCAQAQVDELKKAGCDYIIALGHLGVDKGSKGNTSLDVINNTKGIDLFVDGHSHTQISEGKILKDQDLYLDIAKTGDTVLASTGTALANVGVVTYDGKTTTAILRNDVIADTAVGEKVAKYDKDTKEKYKAEVGKSEVNFNTAKAPGNRTMETNMGDFATDAMLYAARKAGYKADLALTNGGGIRPAKALDNPTTMTEYDMVTVFPFGNQVVIFDILGSALLQAVEDNTKSVPASDGGFPQTSGMTYSIDTSATYVEKEVHRVTIETVAGKPFDPKATYSLATNDFVGVGGDNYKVFRDYFQNKMSGIALEDALTAYIKDELKGVVTAEKYGKPAGRITIKYLGVEPGQWYVAAAKQVIDNKIMVSTGKGFDPTGTVTRGTIYQMLFNMEGRPTKDIKASAFTDIAGKWYADAANWAVSAKLLDDTDKTFGEEVITRGELATIIAAYAGYKGIVVATEGMAMKEAPDYATIPAGQLSGMTFCFYGKLMTGDQNKNLNPMGKLTRAEMAQVMYNFAKLPIAYTT